MSKTLFKTPLLGHLIFGYTSHYHPVISNGLNLSFLNFKYNKQKTFYLQMYNSNQGTHDRGNRWYSLILAILCKYSLSDAMQMDVISLYTRKFSEIEVVLVGFWSQLKNLQIILSFLYSDYITYIDSSLIFMDFCLAHKNN